MGLFEKNKTPQFIKEDSDAEKQLSSLLGLKESASGQMLDRIDQEISKVEAGIAGEKQVHFELANSHMSMCVLHDLFFEDDHQCHKDHDYQDNFHGSHSVLFFDQFFESFTLHICLLSKI